MSTRLLEDDLRHASPLNLCSMCQTLTRVLDEWSGHFRTEVDLFYYTHPDRVLGSIKLACPICVRLFYEMEGYQVLDKELWEQAEPGQPMRKNKSVIRSKYSTDCGGLLYFDAIIYGRGLCDLETMLAPRPMRKYQELTIELR